MLVIEKNVITGKVTQRQYTQKEKDAVAVMAINEATNKVIRDKEADIKAKRESAIEKILMNDTSIEALAYQDAKR
ncbi:MAG: hypothetical protein HOG49_19415 [Candidatus Scalindua sp.]|jgi:hypothetical protein|nr:hypothetical protein [Candidatus Scalindua sp.]